MQSRRRFFCVPGGACTAGPGFSLFRWTAHSRHAGTMDRATAQPRPQPPQSHATGQGYRGVQASPETSHRATHSGAQGQAIHSSGQIPPETPINAPQSRPGRGCYPYTTRRQNAAQGRTEPPTEGKPPGVQKSRGGQAHSRHSPGATPAQRPGQESGRFSVIFRVIFCDFSRLCPALPVSFIVESR